jgi:hypothetical protein
MRLVRGFGAFWYDFIVGDDRKIAAAVGLTLVLGAAAAATEAWWIAPLMGAAIVIAFVLSLAIDVRRA